MYRIDRMRRDYERFTKAQGYIIGFFWEGLVYGVYWDKIPRRYTKIQKECSRMGGGYGLYVDIKSKKVRQELLKKAFYVCTLEELESSTLFSDGAPTKRKQYKQVLLSFCRSA